MAASANKPAISGVVQTQRTMPHWDNYLTTSALGKNTDRYCMSAVKLLQAPLQQFQTLGHEFFWIALGQIETAVGGIVGVGLLTHWLDPLSYGELILAVTLVTLTQNAIFPAFAPAVARFFAPAEEAGQLHTYLHVVQAFCSKQPL